jgi:hypothetical protein
MRAFAVGMVMLGTTLAAADPELVATGRVGMAHMQIDDENADTPATGDAFTVGAELGIALHALHIQPGIAIDAGQYSYSVNNYDEKPFTQRQRTLAISARLRMELTSIVDVSASVGMLVLQQESDGVGRHTFGLHYELGAGVRLWQDERQAVRVDVTIGTTHFTPDGDDLSLTQLGASLGYSIKL